jgi:flavin reductase
LQKLYARARAICYNNRRAVSIKHLKVSVSIDSTLFRKVMRRFPTGVTVLTVRDGEQIHGMTANSFTSVSLNPTLVLVSINQHNATHALVKRAGYFVLNILSVHQEYLAKRFAKQVTQPADPFSDVQHHPAISGAPIFDESIAHLDCRVVATHDAGDHTIFIGEVQDAGFGAGRYADPLLWLDGNYRQLDETPTQALLLSAQPV